jgi:hypothetical protein
MVVGVLNRLDGGRMPERHGRCCVLLLLGGLIDAVTVPTDRGSGSDVAVLARRTLLPASLWKAGHITVAVLCVWKGIQLLTT